MINKLVKQIVSPFFLSTIILGFLGILFDLIDNFSNEFFEVSSVIEETFLALFLALYLTLSLIILLIFSSSNTKEQFLLYGIKFPVILSICSVSLFFLFLFSFEFSNFMLKIPTIGFIIIPILIVVLSGVILTLIFKTIYKTR